MALAFAGVSGLYQGYFAEPERVRQLSTDLGGCFDGLVEVIVGYDSLEHVGRIVLQTSAADLRCRPRAGEEGVDLSPLVPVAAALARYRSGLAAERDVRVSSFRTGVRLVQGGEICDLWLGGQYPPDGSSFSPCIGLRGHERCLGERGAGIVQLPWPPGEGAEVLRTCLSL